MLGRVNEATREAASGDAVAAAAGEVEMSRSSSISSSASASSTSAAAAAVSDIARGNGVVCNDSSSFATLIPGGSSLDTSTTG